jgi:hypothetical protein
MAHSRQSPLPKEWHDERATALAKEEAFAKLGESGQRRFHIYMALPGTLREGEADRISEMLANNDDDAIIVAAVLRARQIREMVRDGRATGDIVAAVEQ